MLSYRLFQLRLMFNLSNIILDNQLISLKKRASFISIAVLFAMTAGLLISKLTANEAPVIQLEETVVAAAPQPKTGSGLTEEKLSLKEIEQRLIKYEAALEMQPTHFDLLINTALLHQAAGNHERAEDYFSQARTVNPNHQYFK